MTNPFEATVDDNYNPFAMTGNYDDPPVQSGTLDSPATSSYQEPASSNNYPSSNASEPTNTAGSQSAGLKDTVTGLRLSEADIRKREEILADREKRIADRERQVEDARANGTLDELNKHKRNFPIILKMYKYYPDEFIAEDARPLLKKVMLSTYIGCILLIINALTTVFCLLPGPNSVNESSKAAPILFSFLYLVVVYPLSLELCLMPLYNSIKDGKALKFIGFLFSYGVLFLFFIYLAVGLGDYGSVGWIISIQLFSAEKNKWVAAIALIFSIAATAFVCLLGWFWIIAFRYYKANDIKSKALGEAAVAAGNYANEHKDEIAQAARDNPELAMQAANIAATTTV